MPIEARREEALGIINGWLRDKTPIFFSASMYGFSAEGRGRIFAADAGVITLSSADATFFAGFPITDMLQFWYAEAREVGSSQLLGEQELSNSGIGISLPERKAGSPPEKLVLIALPK